LAFVKLVVLSFAPPRGNLFRRQKAKGKRQEGKKDLEEFQKRTVRNLKVNSNPETLNFCLLPLACCLPQRDCFHLWSDVDIAAWGIAPKDTFRAMDAAWQLDEEIEVNLVDVNCCKPAILASIEKEGVEL